MPKKKNVDLTTEEMTPEELFAQIVADKGDIKLSLHRVLKGFIAKMGGPEHFGEEMAEIASNPECNISSRVSLMNNMTKLLGQCAEGEDENTGFTEEEIEAMLRQAQGLTM